MPDDWIWDSWIADDGERYHLYFLKAPRSLLNAELRHERATVGHATSTDLRNWTYRGEALRPDRSGWDDLAVWTGSVARGDDGVWRMYYTAINTRGYGLKDQRIGMVESDDLHFWRRVLDRPVVEVDPRWYRTLEADRRASETWRDPFVFRDPDGDGWRMLITARARDADPKDDGVLAEARSADMVHWDLGPPVCAPGAGFGQLEVPQVRMIDGRAVLVFTCHPLEQSEQRITRSGRYCTWSVVADAPTGPWDIGRAQPFTAEPALFAAPLVLRRDGRWALIGFRNTEPEGVLSFEIIAPIPVALRGDRLVAAADELPDLLPPGGPL